MKYLLTFVLLVVTSFSSFAYDEATYLIVEGDLETPITVKCSNGETYKVWDEYTIPEITSVREAFDKYGNRIVVPLGSSSSSTNKYHYRYYRFSMLYKSSSSSSSNSYSSSSDDYRSNSSGYNAGRQIGEGLASMAAIRASYEDGNAYPGLHMALGASKGYGEFARLRMCAGGFLLYGGVGKDWLMDGVNKDKLLWHAGLGLYFSFGGYEPNSDFSLGFSFAENAAWEGLSFMIDMDYTHWFGDSQRFGVFAGGGIGWGEIKNAMDTDTDEHTKFAWNVEVGLTVRICSF